MPGHSVVHVIAPGHYGGAESVVRALAVANRSRGTDARVAVLFQVPGPSQFADALRADGVPVDEIRCGRRRYRREMRMLAEILIRHPPALVHTHGYHADLVGQWAARRVGIPVVATAHGFTGGTLRNRFYEWVDIQALKRCDGVFCVAESVRARLLGGGVAPSRAHLVTNAMAPSVVQSRSEASAALGLTAEGPVLGWIGRLSSEKGADLFVDALANLSMPGVQAVLIGDGPERDAVASRAAGLPPGAPTLRLAGARPAAATLISAFDLLVISSRTEGTPMVLLEAMQAGVPVVSFAVGGVPDVLGTDGGWLVKPGDPEALAAAIRDALLHRDESRRRAAVARTILANRFGVEQWLEKVDAVYRRVLVR